MDGPFDFMYQTDDPDETVQAAEPGDSRAEGVKQVTLDALAEMRGVGMNFVRRIEKRAAGEMNESELAGMARVGDDCVAFERMARAVRQIIALEQETVGIRPMPRSGNGSGGDRRGDDDADEAPARPESLRTGSTRGARNDLRDPQTHKEREQVMVAVVKRVDAAAKLDLAAAGLAEEAAKNSPYGRITAMIYAVPRPNFEACLHQISLEPLNAGMGAMIRGSAKPGIYQPPEKPP